ncbi:MAG: sensor histidine kinase [Candidatus Levyibacteriota bacterium]
MKVKINKLVTFLFPYAIAIISVALSFGLSLSAFFWLGKPTYFLLFLPAIIISSWYGGVKAGLFANIVSAIVIYYAFITPVNSFQIKSIVSIIQLTLFILEGLIVSYFIDSGRRYEKIATLRQRERNARKKIETLELELKNAREEIVLRDEFLSIASHELKTPLTTVVLQIQSTLHNIRNVSLSEFSVEHLLRMLQSMQGQTTRLSKMINDLLNISLITTHRMELEPEELELEHVLHDTVEGFTTKFEKEGTTIAITHYESIIGKWDKLRLGQALDNFISNALKYGNKKPVTIELERKNSTAIIRIVDKGIGIKKADKDRIFSLFKRGSVEKNYKGLGIGLYIAQQIILLHGGKIHCKSSIGKGTTFIVSLPIRKA